MTIFEIQSAYAPPKFRFKSTQTTQKNVNFFVFRAYAGRGQTEAPEKIIRSILNSRDTPLSAKNTMTVKIRNPVFGGAQGSPKGCPRGAQREPPGDPKPKQLEDVI